MAVEKIGMKAVLEDEDFQKGFAKYDKTVDKSTKKTEAAAKKMSKGWKTSGINVKSALTGMAIGFGAVTAAAFAVSKALAFGQRGAQVTQTAESFDGLIKSVGASEDTLQRLRAASKGTVDDMTLMSSTTTLLAGAQGDLARAMADAAPQLVEIAKAANKLNPTLGETTFLYQSLGTGIKRSSPLILDNLGLTIKIGEANEAYAAKLGKTVAELSAMDKQQALLEETLRAGNVLIEQAGGSTDSATDSFTRLNTSVKNLTDHLAAKAAPAIGTLADALNDLVYAIFEARAELDRLNQEAVTDVQTYEDYVDVFLEAAVATDVLTEEQADYTRALLAGDEAAQQVAGSLLDIKGRMEGAEVAQEALTEEGWEHTRMLAQMEGMLGATSESVAVLQGKQRILNKALLDGAVSAKQEEDALKALNDAVKKVRKSFEDFYGTLASGIVGLRDLDAAAVKSAKDYKKALKDLAKSAGKSYESIREKYEDSLPDKTTDQERLDMAGDAWDEFGRRAEDVIQRGAESPWWGQLQEELMAIGETQPPDVGIQEWMRSVQDAFYEGDLPGLINQDAVAWQKHAEAVKAAQEEEAAAVRQANAEKRAAIKKAREEQLQAEKEARERATIELALSIAEQTGMLQQWSMQRFGPDFSQVGDTASEVMALLDAGILDIDADLGDLITNTAGGIADALDLTGQQAEDTKAQLADLISPETIAEAERQTASLATGLRGVGESGKDAMDELNTAIVEGDPSLTLITGFQGVETAIIASAGNMDTALVTAFTNIDTAQGTVADHVLERWVTGSVFPEMILSSQTMEDALVDDFDTMSEEFSTAAEEMDKAWADFMENMRSDWRDTYDLFIDGIKNINEELDDIPREIQIIIKTVYEDGEAQHGAVGVAGQTFLVGEQGPELFTMPGAGMIIPNDISMNILAQVPRLQAPQGPATQVGGAVSVSFGDVSISSGMDWATFLAGTEQAVVTALKRGS